MSLCQFFGFFHIIRAFHTYIVFIIISASRNGSLKYTCVTILNFHCNSIILSHYRISDYSRINFIYLFSLSRIDFEFKILSLIAGQEEVNRRHNFIFVYITRFCSCFPSLIIFCKYLYLELVG